MAASSPLSWEDMSGSVIPEVDLHSGEFSPRSTLRTFGARPEDIRVTLYRDHHFWCPYCQKVALYLEEHKIPYRVKKVTMFCYGDKESWYRRVVPSGMLPALDLDGEIITESDDILFSLDDAFGPLGSHSLSDPKVLPFRRLERKLFGAWCNWLCRRHFPPMHESRAEGEFKSVAKEVDDALGVTKGPFFLGETYTVADIIFTPYIERMSASLTYYKGFNIRESYSNIDRWFSASEERPVYRGSQSDFHTHVHDLPPQMGSCNSNGSKKAREYQDAIDGGGIDDRHFRWETTAPASKDAKFEAVSRVYKHRNTLAGVNPMEKDVFDDAVRSALTNLINGSYDVKPPKGSAIGLRYLRDRISCPRDMSIHAARELRIALEMTARLDGDGVGPPIKVGDRRDQNPRPFVEARERVSVE